MLSDKSLNLCLQICNLFFEILPSKALSIIPMFMNATVMSGSMLWLCSVAPARLLPLCPVAPAITAGKWARAQEAYSNRKDYRRSGLIKDILVKVCQFAGFLLTDADGPECASQSFPSTERERKTIKKGVTNCRKLENPSSPGAL